MGGSAERGLTEGVAAGVTFRDNPDSLGWAEKEAFGRMGRQETEDDEEEAEESGPEEDTGSVFRRPNLGVNRGLANDIERDRERASESDESVEQAERSSRVWAFSVMPFFLCLQKQSIT